MMTGVVTTNWMRTRSMTPEPEKWICQTDDRLARLEEKDWIRDARTKDLVDLLKRQNEELNKQIEEIRKKRND